MSFDVTDNNITASGYASGFCASNSIPPIYNDAFSFDSLTTGVIAADGSFTLQTSQNYSWLFAIDAGESSGDQYGAVFGHVRGYVQFADRTDMRGELFRDVYCNFLSAR